MSEIENVLIIDLLNLKQQRGDPLLFCLFSCKTDTIRCFNNILSTCMFYNQNYGGKI